MNLNPTTQTPKEARFYIYDPSQECYTQVVLQPGEEHTLSGGGRTEEGYRYWSDVYRHEGERLARDYSSSSHDCDGPGSNEQNLCCPLDKLETQECYEFEQHQIKLPEWTEINSSQRDYYAERGGY